MRKLTCVFLSVIILCCVASAQSPVATVVAGYNFTHSDQGNGFANLNGWFGQASFTLKGPASLVFEADNYYGRFAGSSVNQHSYVVGPQFTFNSSGKLQPFLYGELGDQRSSSSGTASNAFTTEVGGGVQIKLSQHVGLYLAPVEWDFAKPSGGTLNSFASKYGLMFSFGQK